MAIRVNKLLSELNMGLTTLDSMLDALGRKEGDLTINTKISDDIAVLLKSFGSRDNDLRQLVEIAVENEVYGGTKVDTSPLTIIGRIDLDELNANGWKRISRRQQKENQYEALIDIPTLTYSQKQDFWISELVVLSQNNRANSVSVGSFEVAEGQPLYSVLIGTNGAGKSTMMKEIVDFFVDLHACVNEKDQKLSFANKGRLKGIRYHIDGVECEVIRMEKTYFARVDGYFRNLKELRLPAIVACHFGAFEKLPTQSVNGLSNNKYDVPFYKYVGAHVNGSMISSSAIAFRLLFALSEQMDDRQQQNIRSILDFIKYDHKITLSYTFALKKKSDKAASVMIDERVAKDKNYKTLTKQEKSAISNLLLSFYKIKTASGQAQHEYEIDFDTNTVSEGADNELQKIYKLKQCDLVTSANVIFHKNGCDITSEEMSSGEFAILTTVLSISAASDDTHTLVLLDEPELSLHPNWQMMLIDNLNMALHGKACHLLIATHSHMVVSDLPMKRSFVSQIEKDKEGNMKSTAIAECTYGWSAEEVLFKVFKTVTDRNRFFGERIGKLLEGMANNTVDPEKVKRELKDLQEISLHLSDIDPMKTVLNTIVDTYNKKP